MEVVGVDGVDVVPVNEITVEGSQLSLQWGPGGIYVDAGTALPLSDRLDVQLGPAMDAHAIVLLLRRLAREWPHEGMHLMPLAG
jgi:hypothetical protein